MRINLLLLLLLGFNYLSAGIIQDSWQPKIKWKFRQKGTLQWFKKNVVGNVHLDLYHNGLIPHPFYGTNEQKLQSIENEDWEYEGSFSASLAWKHFEISLNGLDTYASVYLNDSLILVTDNMFREWKTEITRFLKEGQNKLYILFRSPVKIAKEEALKLPYRLPEDERVFARKAQYHYGWDWGPRFISFGITSPVVIHGYDKIQLVDVTYNLTKMSEQLAELEIIYTTNCDVAGNYNLKCSILDSAKQYQQPTSSNKFLHKGINIDTLKYLIPKPELWWCKGYGKAKCYNLLCSIDESGLNLSSKRLTVGLKKIELITEKDSVGSAFYFKLNGVPVFVKGANYIPQHSFLNEVRTENVEALVKQAADAGMNMLRVWGGGVYGSDEFYNACDRNGILVWQDCMFACAMYPGDQKFLENVKQEVKEQSVRLRNHPSLALWCGNNESDEGWKNWGWQKQFAYSGSDSAKIWNDYERLFHNLIPSVLRENNPQIPYWPSSPSIGWGHKESLQSGDSHYWGVWWGNEPFETYSEKVGRFMSEYGFQSLPDYSTFKKFCPDSELYLGSASVKAHQKHKTGFEIINEYMQRSYKIPAGFREYIYVSQLLQRDGMKIAIEAHRAAGPHCMGTMFWQLNDCWPVSSWSAIDYYGSPKAFYYALKRLFAPELVVLKKKRSALLFKALFDKPTKKECDITIGWMDFFGKNYWSRKFRSLTVNTERFGGFPLDQIVNALDYENLRSGYPSPQNAFIYATLNTNTDGASAILLLMPPKDLMLPIARINIKSAGNNTYFVSSDVFAKDVYLYSEDEPLVFVDNYFDLMPGQTKKVTLLSNKSLSADKIKFLVLNNIKQK